MIRPIVFLALALSCSVAISSDLGKYYTHSWDQVQSTFGNRPRMMLVPSEDPVADSAYIQGLETNGPDGFCRSIAKVLGKGETELMTFALAGPNSERTLAVLKGMDIVNGERKLPMLQFLFLGSSEHAQQARQIVEGWGSTFVFLSHEDYASTSVGT